MKRYLSQFILSDLKEKMVFVGGPRQVGKTTLAQKLGVEDFAYPYYLNWDYPQDRKKIIARKFGADADLLIFDELHKYGQWKNYLKGEYDKNRGKYKILVTGSARLDVYRRGGDSLLGRYHYLRLHPFSLAEVLDCRAKVEIGKALHFKETEGTQVVLNRLMMHGGFPEPFLKDDDEVTRRFHNERAERLIKEDIRDVERMRDLSALQVLASLLPERVGSLFSINSLKEDLGVTHRSLSLWVDVLERFYYHYRIYPFASTLIKSLKKEPKLYLWDWSEVESEPAKFENLVASHLLKFVHFLYDVKGYKTQLHFLRDREGHEVDFLVSIKNKPWFLVEVKLRDETISNNVHYFKNKLHAPYSFQVLLESGVDFVQDGVRCISADKFLTALV